MTRKSGSPSPVLTMAEAATWLGLRGRYAAQWLRRYLLARETATGEVILLRSGRNPRRARYRVSLANLRRHCPELVDPTDEIARSLKALVLHQKREREDIVERLEDIQADIHVLTEAVRRTR